MYIEKLNEILNKVFVKLGYEIDASVTLSDRPLLCDYQSNDCFKIAKKYGVNPIEVGNAVVNELCSFTEYFKSVDFVKPGFINFVLSDEFLCEYMRLYNEDIKSSINCDNYKMVIDYGGPNVAKPLHVGHMRTAIVGESVKRILKFFGNDVVSDVHLGDIGLQIGQVIYKVIEDKKTIDEIDLEYLNYAYPLMSGICKSSEEIKSKCAEITRLLQNGNAEYKTIWKKICEVSVGDIKKNYDYLDVHFDYWYGESDSYDYLGDVTKVFSDLLKVSEGAKVIDVSDVTDKLELPPLLFQTSIGSYLYAATDLATIYQRIKDFNPDKILYVTDARQSLHFKQVFRASEKAELFSMDNLEHLAYGTVNGLDNKPYKTRSGDTPKLENLFLDAKDIFISKKEENKNLSDEDLNKIVNSILKFADLQNSREKDYIFDLGKFSNVFGKTGPYILYTYLRVKKVLSDYEINDNLSNNVYNEYDRNLRLKLLEVGKSLTLSYEERKPNYICDYLYNLCSVANIFYQNNYLNNLENKQELNDYLYILNLTNKYIKTLLDLLVIEIPDKM